tara:strand:+ start:101 stop:2308 length:2208 start_codon:yes stop_codon:yes gene_type:complete
MGIISSLFKSAPAAPTVSGQPIQVSEIPSELKPYYKDILGKAQALYDKRVGEGYQAYKGPTIAKLTPEQEQAYTGIAALQGQAAPKFAEAEALTRQGGADITGAEIQEAMSPYQQAVTDIEKRQSQREFEQNVLPKIRASQVAQGSFGGTRGTLLEAQSLGDQQRLLGDIQAKGSQSAFADARRALEAQRNRSGQAGSQLSNIAPLATKTISGEIGLQQAVGEDKQRYSQAALDEAYRQFQAEQQEPYDAMQKYQSVVTGAPIGGTQYASAQPQPSLGQTLIGGLGTAIGAYGAFGGLDKKGKTGGGISSLPLIKQANGSQDNTLSPNTIRKYNDASFMNVFVVPPRPGGHSGRSWDRQFKSKGFKAGDKLGNYRVTSTGKKEVRPFTLIEPELTKKVTSPESQSTERGGSAIKRRIESIDLSEKPSSKADLVAQKEVGLSGLKKVIGEQDAMQTLIGKEIDKLPTREQSNEELKKYYADKETRAGEAQKQDDINTRRQQFANMAQFFARLGTASPQGSGLQGVVSAGLKAAEQTAPDVIATQTKAQARKQERANKKEGREDKKRIEKISNKTKDLEKLQAKYSLLEKKNASQAALAKAETDILEAQATITQLEFQTNTQLRDIMPTNENLKKRLEQLTKGSIVSTAPGYDTAQARALMQAETEVMADLNILQRKSQSAFRETTEGEVSRAILDRAVQLLNSNPKFNKNISNNKKDINENNTQDAADTINKLLNE